MKNILLFAMLLFGSSCVQATVQGKEITYAAGDTVLKGYIAYDGAIVGRGRGFLADVFNMR